MAEPCQCKEEVEREEAQALAAAMERSSVNQDKLPHIPGLTRELGEKTVTIHVQDEVRTILSVIQLLKGQRLCIAFYGKPITEPESITCHMGSHV